MGLRRVPNGRWHCKECAICSSCGSKTPAGNEHAKNAEWQHEVSPTFKNFLENYHVEMSTPGQIQHIIDFNWLFIVLQFKKDKDNKQLKYATTLCVPCDKYWKRRQFCYVCLKVYRSIPEDGMVRCSNCPKYIHREGMIRANITFNATVHVRYQTFNILLVKHLIVPIAVYPHLTHAFMFQAALQCMKMNAFATTALRCAIQRH